MVTKIVDMHMMKEEFVTHVTTQVEEFSEHVSRIRIEYQEMKCLKDSLPPNHCIVHMDFSENYSCKSVEEIQSAYWNQTGFTLHPAVIYYRTAQPEELKHKSVVFVSDKMAHSSTTVLTITDKLIPEVKLMNPAYITRHVAV